MSRLSEQRAQTFFFAQATEGVRRNNFIGTSLIGPLLVVNPHFTRGLLARLDPDSEPTLAHEELALAAYDARLADFRDDRRWHPFERVPFDKLRDR